MTTLPSRPARWYDEYDATRVYPAGSIVKSGAAAYVSLENQVGVEPPGDTWLALFGDVVGIDDLPLVVADEALRSAVMELTEAVRELRDVTLLIHG